MEAKDTFIQFDNVLYIIKGLEDKDKISVELLKKKPSDLFLSE